MAMVLQPDSAVTGYFLGTMGLVASMSLSAYGACYGTAKAGTSISCMAVPRPDLIVKCLVPVVMAGIIAIYGLIMSVLINTKLQSINVLDFDMYQGILMFGAGLSVGGAGFAAGIAVGEAGSAGVRGVTLQPKFFIGMILILIFAEVLGLYGLIVSLILYVK